MTWHSIDIPAQTPMVFPFNAAKRDPAVYPEPHLFDISPPGNALVAFGQGPHSCLRNWLPFEELGVALRALLDRLPNLRLAPGAADNVRITSQVVTTLRGPNSLPVTFDPGH